MLDTLKGEEARPKDISDLEWNKINKKAIAYIRQWINTSSHHHVSNETNAYNLWKKLESVFEQKTTRNKIFLLKKLVNMKLKEGTLITNHMNAFQSIVNQLATMKMVMDDEMQASLLLCSLPNNWATFVVTISNSIPNGALSMEFVKGNLFNEETKKAYGTENAQTLIIESKGRNRNRRKKDHDKFKGRS